MVKRLVVLAALVLSVVAPGLAQADVVFGSSSASVLSADLYYDGGDVDASWLSFSDTAPPPYSQGFGPASFNDSTSLFSLSIESAEVGISSDVDGTAGSKTTSGSMDLTNLSLTFLDILSFNAPGTFSSSASVSGDFGSLIATAGTAVGTGASLTVLGSGVTITGGEVYNQDGLRIFMGDIDASGGETIGTASSTVMFVEFTDFEHEGQTFNGTLALGSTAATQQAVPEPASLLVLGGLGLAAACRRKRGK